MTQKLVTIQRHIMEEQRLHPKASGDFTNLLWDLMLAFKLIAREVNKAGLVHHIMGMAGTENVHGEMQAKLDRFSHDTIYRAMDHGGHLCVMASEEHPEVIAIPDRFPKGHYVLMFDPLDGSSNIDVNISIGSIFSIHRKITPGKDGSLEDCLQKGSTQIAAGYCIYGSSTMLVYTTGHGVHGFTLDPSIGEFFLSHKDIRIPSKGKIYSINEGNHRAWDEGTRGFVNWVKEKDVDSSRPYSLRYVGTLVADFHRTLLKGGIFLYPADVSNPARPPKPKLRLLYEAAPMAFICEQAGGKATTGNEPILEIVPRELHQKVPLIIGSPEDVGVYEEFFSGKRK